MHSASRPIFALKCPATMLQISPTASQSCVDASSAGTPSICDAIRVAVPLAQRKVKLARNAPAIPTVPVTFAPAGGVARSARTTVLPTIMENTSAVAANRMSPHSDRGGTCLSAAGGWKPGRMESGFCTPAKFRPVSPHRSRHVCTYHSADVITASGWSAPPRTSARVLRSGRYSSGSYP